MSGFLPLLLAAAALPAPGPAEQTAIFKAAGFVQRGAAWKSGNCDGLESESYEAGRIDAYRDLNGDSQAEAIVIESGAISYGNTATHFWLLSKQADDTWRVVTSELGIPEFLGTKGVGDWPDLMIGGPGFCFPVWKWNGREYRLNRFEYEGKACQSDGNAD